jgi:excisionase family DNA binding protein
MCDIVMSMKENQNSKYMTPKQAAEHYGVHLNTVMKWIRDGKLESIQPAGPRGNILIPR